MSNNKEHPKLIFLGLVIVLGFGIYIASRGVTGLLTGSVEVVSRRGPYREVTWADSPGWFAFYEIVWLGVGALLGWSVAMRMYRLAKERRD